MSRLGKYLLLEHVNQGGMADVFLAKTFGFGGADQLIALKCIRPEVQADGAFITMFVNEAKLSALLSHAHIAKTYELGRINDAYFIAMEYVSGRDLRALIDRARARGTQIPIGLSLFVIAAVLEGLDYAHRKIDLKGQPLHIVHSDVSPKNVLVGYAGEVKLIDFGIARAAQGSTHGHGMHGKVGYMAPEQVRGDAIDARSDVFAAGALLFELLTQARLFEGSTDAIVRDKVRRAEILPPTLINPSLPSDIEAIVMRALGRTPGERYPNAESMHRDVVEVMLRRYGHTQARDLGTFLRKLFDDEHREDLARIERAMQITAIPENVPEHHQGVERTAMVNLAAMGEENTAPEATRFASVLPGGVVITHPFAKSSTAAAVAAAVVATRPPLENVPAPAPPAPSAMAGSKPQVVLGAERPRVAATAGAQTSSWSPPPVNSPPVNPATPALPPLPVSPLPVAATETPASEDAISKHDAATVVGAWPTPPALTPPASAPAPRPQPLHDVEVTDVEDRPEADTAVVAREAGTDPNVTRALHDTTRQVSAATPPADDDERGGDTAIVRTEGTRIASVLDAAQPEDDDYTDRIHKSLAILGVHEDSDSNIEPTQVAYRSDPLKRIDAVGGEVAALPPTSPAAAVAPAEAGQTTDPRVPALEVRRETVERLQAFGITGGGDAAHVIDDDADDATDRVLRSGAGAIEPVPREVTIIDRSRRMPSVDDWAREARGKRRSGGRRAILIGFVCLLIGATVTGALWLRRTGRLPFGAATPAVGSLVIISHPAGAEVLIDGRVWGTTPFSSPKVPPGLHQVVVRAVAGKQRALEVLIRERDVVTREVRLDD